MKLSSMKRVKKGDFCNLLPSFMEDYDSYDLTQSEFTKKQYIDLINKQIDIRVKDKYKDMWSYFRIEWYDDDKMYDLYLPDKHLDIIRYIFEGDRVIINPTKIEDIIISYSFTDNSGNGDVEKEVAETYRKWAKNKTVFKVLSTYWTDEPYNRFSNNWCVLHNDDIKNHDIIEYVSLPDWCLLKPMYPGNKKPQIKKFINY